MNKIIVIFAFAFVGLLAFIPGDAHAAKLKIEPSVTFRNSHTHYYQPRQRVYVQRPPVVYGYYGGYAPAPYYEEVVMVEPPRYYVEPCYYPPVQSYGTDFQLKFKIK